MRQRHYIVRALDDEPEVAVTLSQEAIWEHAHSVPAGPVQKWRRSYLYGWCRANGHNRLAWFFANKSGRQTLSTLREIRRAGW